VIEGSSTENMRHAVKPATLAGDGYFISEVIEMASMTRSLTVSWIGILLFSVLLSLSANAQKKPFDAAAVVSPELLNGPSSATHDQLKPVKLDPALFGRVVGKMDVDTGQVRRMEGKIQLPEADSEQKRVETFIQKNGALLGASTESGDLKLIREVKSATGDHFYYQQLYQGLPLWGGRVSVHNVVGSKAAQVVNELRKLSPPSDKLPGTMPDFTESNKAKAIEVAEKAINFKAIAPRPPTAEPGFLEVQGQPLAVWRVHYTTTEPGAVWEVMIDPSTMKALSARNIAAYQQDPKASVFHADPVGRTGKPNLLPAPNAQDPNFDILQGARLPVALTELGGNDQLDGKYATTNLTTVFDRAKAANLDFTYDWNDPHFREAMSYYWVTECVHYLANLGYTNVFASKIGINVDGTTDDNSWYTSGTLTFGSGGVPDAEDAEVIFHELGHAIQDAQVPGLLNDGGQEVRAISEGFGDYWAASYFGGIGPRGSTWDVFFDKWDGITAHAAAGANPPYLRRLDSSKKYPADLNGEVHDDGEIWSACLWKIRQILGKDMAAHVILESNFQLTPSSRFPDAAKSILNANLKLNADKHSLEIRKVFADRGILPPTVSKAAVPKPNKQKPL
jgi:Zn-dependent metalloprotease